MKLLEESDQSTAKIAEGSGVSFYWLRKFRSNEFADPSVNRVERVYRYLSGQTAVEFIATPE